MQFTDGGGVKGRSEVEILRHLQSAMEKRGYPKDVCFADIFDIICGTSTGGLIAIMIGRLRMTIPQIIEMYEKLSKDIFKSNILLTSLRMIASLLQYRYKVAPLEKRVREIVRMTLGDESAGMVNLNSKCHVFVVAVDAENLVDVDPVLFRSYSLPGIPAAHFPIWKVARATSAAPTYFEAIEIDGRRYADGGMGYNNPMDLAMEEAQKLFPGEAINVMLSIGCGEGKPVDWNSPRRAALHWVTSATGVDAHMRSCYGSSGRYFRFSVDGHFGSRIGLAAWDKMDRMTRLTRTYLKKESRQVGMFADLMMESLKAKQSSG